MKMAMCCVWALRTPSPDYSSGSRKGCDGVGLRAGGGSGSVATRSGVAPVDWKALRWVVGRTSPLMIAVVEDTSARAAGSTAQSDGDDQGVYAGGGDESHRAASRNISRAGKLSGRRTRMRRADWVMMAATLSRRMRSVSNCIVG